MTPLTARTVFSFYPWIRSLLFRLDAERSHHFTLRALSTLSAIGALKLLPKPILCPRQVMGLTFPNPVGLAAGLDKNAEALGAWQQLGFGFVEVGTLTPKPQVGNPRPRLFRLPEHHSLINRMGFNNVGIDQALRNIDRANYHGILGINIGKNASTPNEQAVDDYTDAMRRVYAHADYITVNISSPNTVGLRELQHNEYLKRLLSTLKELQQQLHAQQQKYVPLVIKLSPDLATAELAAIARELVNTQMDGVALVNTSLARPQVMGHIHAAEAGGLSGAAITTLAEQGLQQLASFLEGQVPIISLGGIMSAEDSVKRFTLGASLIQLYTGLIYQGPQLVRDILTRVVHDENCHHTMV